MSWTGRRVLVTGADGFIGSHLTARLVELGAEVTALAFYDARDTFGWLDEVVEAGCPLRLERGDVRDAELVRRLVSSQQYVYHLAALIGIPYSYAAPASYIRTNVEGTLNVLTAARDVGVERVVHTSTSEVYGTARFTPITEEHPLHTQSPYAASKAAADHLAEAFHRSYGLPVVTLRPFNTYGPRQSERAVISTIIRQALDPRLPHIGVGDLSTRRDFNFVSDIVEAFIAVGGLHDQQMGEVYNAGSGHTVAIGDVVAELLDLTGSAKPVVHQEDRLRPADSEVLELMAAADRLRDATGWHSRVNLRDGLRLTVDWWQDRIRTGPPSSHRYFT
jgi:NAD dependent epimerase/dehydratase